MKRLWEKARERKKENNNLYLNETSRGSEYLILEIKELDANTTKLIELGMTTNSKIKVIINNKIFSSMIVRMKGTLLIISKRIAKNIKVKNILKREEN